MDKYQSMSRAELAALCRKHELSDEGSAAVLRKRIREAREAAKARKAAATPAEPTVPAVQPDEPTGDELPQVSGTEETPEPAPDAEGTYEVSFTFGSLDYLDDQGWETANRKLVEKRATEAGCRLVGNARRGRVEGTTVTYVVPVE